ncbi:MAG: 16S rRNA (guanine(966)-N(2))-methyltransferase RsmD [Bacteroidetes bacterium GWF2_33_16]|nr:MAG: 16S rRNA (guanine(966)-N(2))-methyltransferase RsmD [Bacteroidetes bacterium GWE2_32_14]OFY03815.1 MAG: 16S rRNA (guanine(966)-N(2))-methyltransferase RsmD [Bacteroidetes bacterium GWF2_33_16]
MRIISGSYKGRAIHPPKNFKARPTTDFAKESLFNILNNNFDFSEMKALDLFSGTGSISYELASRGSTDIVSVELNYNHYAFIKKTAIELQFLQIKVIRADVFKYLKTCNKTFDFIFADPPYDMEKIDTIPDIILERKILEEGGWMILEHGSKNNFNDHPNFKEQRIYGSVNFSIFESFKND